MSTRQERRAAHRHNITNSRLDVVWQVLLDEELHLHAIVIMKYRLNVAVSEEGESLK